MACLKKLEHHLPKGSKGYPHKVPLHPHTVISHEIFYFVHLFPGWSTGLKPDHEEIRSSLLTMTLADWIRACSDLAWFGAREGKKGALPGMQNPELQRLFLFTRFFDHHVLLTWWRTVLRHAVFWRFFIRLVDTNCWWPRRIAWSPVQSEAQLGKDWVDTCHVDPCCHSSERTSSTALNGFVWKWGIPCPPSYGYLLTRKIKK